MSLYTIIVPHFNEFAKMGKAHFLEQLTYFNNLACNHNVILIDDASTDDTWNFVKNLPNRKFTAMRMPENGQKIGAIKKAVEECNTKYIVLTDFDSKITNPEKLQIAIKTIEEKGSVGSRLRIIPSQNNLWGIIQDFERTANLVLSIYMQGQRKWKIENRRIRKYEGQKMLTCLEGAGSIWKRDVLMDILTEHSGRHAGDDVETTAIGMKKKHNLIYTNSVTVETQMPESIWGIRQILGLQRKTLTIHQQRKRWEMGGLETFNKEWSFYMHHIIRFTRFGQLVLWRLYNWIILPFGVVFFMNSLYTGNWSLFAKMYLLDIIINTIFISMSYKDLKKRSTILALPFVYFFRLSTYPARIHAMVKFLSNKFNGKYLNARIKEPNGIIEILNPQTSIKPLKL